MNPVNWLCQSQGPPGACAKLSANHVARRTIPTEDPTSGRLTNPLDKGASDRSQVRNRSANGGKCYEQLYALELGSVE